MHGIRQKHTNYSGCTKAVPLELQKERPPGWLGTPSSVPLTLQAVVLRVCDTVFTSQIEFSVIEFIIN